MLPLYVFLGQSQAPLRHVQIRVSHDPLEGKDVSAVTQEVQGKTVPQVIGTDLHFQFLGKVLAELFRPSPYVHDMPFPVGKDGRSPVPPRWTGFQQSLDGLCLDVGRGRVRAMRVLAFSAWIVVSLPRWLKSQGSRVNASSGPMPESKYRRMSA